MASNKFATMLHKNTNKLTLHLVYAMLEWILIILLLLNSLFSYLIIKYTDFFGLKKPCLFCSRLDHIFESSKPNNQIFDLVCDEHGIEISKLGFCLNHRKLAERKGMCEDCETGFSKNITSFPWMKQIGMIQGGDSEIGEVGFDFKCSCSCCGVDLGSELNCNGYLVVDKPCWGSLDCNVVADCEGKCKIDDQGKLGFAADDCGIEHKEFIVSKVDDDKLGVVASDCEIEQKGFIVSEVDDQVKLGFVANDYEIEHKEFIASEVDDDKLGFVASDCETEQKVEDERMILIVSEVDNGEKKLKVDENRSSFVSNGSCKEMLANEPEPEPTEAVNDCKIEHKVEDERGILIVSEVDDGDIELEIDEHWSSFVSNGSCKDGKLGFVASDCESEQKEFIVSEVDDDKLGFVASDCETEQKVEDERMILIVSEVDNGEKKLKVDENRSSFVSNGSCKEMLANEPEPEPTEAVNDCKIEHKVEDERGILIVSEVDDGDIELEIDEHWSSFVSNGSCKEMLANEPEPESTEVDDLNMTMDKWVEVQTQHLEFYIDLEDCQLIPIEDSAAKKFNDEGNFGDEDFIMDFDKPVGGDVELLVKRPALATIDEGEEDAKSAELESVEEFNESSNSVAGVVINDRHSEEAQSNEDTKEILEMQSDQIKTEVSIGQVIPDHKPIDVKEDSSTSCVNLHVQSNRGAIAKHHENEFVEFRTLPVDIHELSMKLNEIEEDKISDTPSSIESVNHLYKKMFLLERKESGTEDSMDGSVMSDIDGADGIMTMEKLKTALSTERKALNMLYSELEEERNASAIAANQTMAMINRLQEEKAAMQMEAVQYQRMMDEQSEYDQEALQILNELMLKREREKAELEKELEIYRKEKIALMRKSRTSSASCSVTADDSDGLSIDLNHEAKEEDSFENTPVDAVLYLEESLASFEEEKLLILEQLKVLEEKLVTLNEEEEHHFENVEPIDHIYEENGNFHKHEFDHNIESNGVASNGYAKEMNRKHYNERKRLGVNAKKLLPLFDAAEESTDGVIRIRNGQVFDSSTLQTSNSPVTEFEVENKKHAIEEEVDHVHDRLQALEADREFLKHCISSLRKGDKGVYLLREILQHLRDLRSMELDARNNV